MNQKTAKKLRKLAKQMATNQLIYGNKGNTRKGVFEVREQTKAEKEGTDLRGDMGSLFIDDKDEAKTTLPKWMPHPGTIVVNGDSFRGVYKQLKKAVGSAK